MDAETWIERFAGELGVQPPTAEQQETILALAGIAAHASERKAAPLACWLAAGATLTPDEALAVAKRLAAATGG